MNRADMSKGMRDMLRRYEHLAGLTIIIARGTGEIIVSTQDHITSVELQKSLGAAEVLEDPAIPGMLYSSDSDHGSMILCPEKTQQGGSHFLILTDFTLSERPVEGLGLPEYDLPYITNLLQLMLDTDNRLSNYQEIRKIAKEEMSTSRQLITQLQLLMNLWKAGRWYYDIQTQENSVDENWKEIFGIPDSVDQEDFHDYFEAHIAEEDRKALHQQMNDYMSGKTEMYHTLFRFDSELHGRIWVEGIGIIYEYHEDGSPKSIIGLNRDVTDAEKRHQELTKTNELLRTILQNMPSGVFWKDTGSIYQGGNDIFARNAGVSSYLDIIGKTDKDLPYVSDEFEFYRAQDIQLIESREPLSEEVHSLHREDGRMGWSYTNKVPLIGDDGEVYGILGVYTDISKLKWTEEQLAERDRRLNAIIECFSDVIWIISIDGSSEYVSPSVEQVLGYSEDEFLALPLHGLMSDDVLKDFTSGLTELINEPTKAVHQISHEIRGSSGKALFVDTSMTSLVDPDGLLLGYLCIIRDMTEKRLLQEERQVSHKMEAVGTLAAGVAHDFNNQLQGILGYTELLLATSDPDPVHRSMLSSIEEAGKRARRLVSQLLAFSRQEEFILERVDLISWTEGMKSPIEELVEPGISLELSNSCEAAPLMGDVNQLEQLLQNLCMNASEAMSGGGVISIRISCEDFSSEVPVFGEKMPSGRYVCMEVTDNGSGMTDQQLQILFDPFYTTKSIGKGAGLGLSIVYAVAKEHKGFVSASRRETGGTVFSIYFPESR